jgi:hypothetical protein
VLETAYTWSFVAGFVPVITFFLLYALRTRWYATLIGRVIFTLAATSVASYGISTATRLWPDSLESTHGLLIRVIARFILAAIFWVVLVLFVWTQSRAVRSRPPTEGTAP